MCIIDTSCVCSAPTSLLLLLLLVLIRIIVIIMIIVVGIAIERRHIDSIVKGTAAIIGIECPIEAKR